MRGAPPGIMVVAAAVEATLRPAAARLSESRRYKHLHDNHKRAETDGFADHVLPPSRSDYVFKTRANWDSRQIKSGQIPRNQDTQTKETAN